MDPMARFGEYAADFEKTYEDDDWTRLEDYFAEDVVYSIAGLPGAECELRGRSNVLRGIRKSLDGFDRRFAKRTVDLVDAPAVEGSCVTIRAHLLYTSPSLDPLEMEVVETVELDEAGHIAKMHDEYPAGQHAALAWLEANKSDFDPSYE